MLIAHRTLNIHTHIKHCNTQFTSFFLMINCIGLLNITTLNCTSKLNDGTCVTSAQRGQPVTLCIGQFTTPSTIPQGNHQNVIGVDKSYWSISHFPLYKCQNGYCEEWPNNSLVNYSNFLNVSDSCLTVNNIGEGLGTAVVVGSATLLYGLRVYFDASGAIQLPSRIEKFSVEPYKGNTSWVIHKPKLHECMHLGLLIVNSTMSFIYIPYYVYS